MIIVSIISFIVGAMMMTFVLGIVSACKDRKPQNKVHLYVARDKNGELWLYMGKPIRTDTAFRGDLDKGVTGLIHLNFRCFGLNENDFDYLKWEDEPVEVFINMKD